MSDPTPVKAGSMTGASLVESLMVAIDNAVMEGSKMTLNWDESTTRPFSEVMDRGIVNVI